MPEAQFEKPTTGVFALAETRDCSNALSGKILTAIREGELSGRRPSEREATSPKPAHPIANQQTHMHEKPGTQGYKVHVIDSVDEGRRLFEPC